jgi:hypothetical protein
MLLMRALRAPLRWLVLLGLAIPAVVTAEPVFDASRAWEHLLAQCSFGPRVPGSPGHARCRDYLERSLRACGAEVTTHRFRGPMRPGSADSVAMTNIRARFGPPDSPPVLLGAHWDTRAWADQDPDPGARAKPIPGANDGASGVAVLLALAELLARTPPPVPVDIVLFDGEDQGEEAQDESYCLGSAAYAEALPPPWPRAVVILDMVGGRDLHICREGISDQLAPWLNDLLFHRARDLGLTVFEDRVGYEVYDDHIAFLRLGIPAVDLIDMQYREWHTLADSPSACSRESLRQVGHLIADIVFGGGLQ